jgi:hypothetical protein
MVVNKGLGASAEKSSAVPACPNNRVAGVRERIAVAVARDAQGLLEVIRVELKTWAVGNRAIKDRDAVHAAGLTQDRTNPTDNPHPGMGLDHLCKFVLRLYLTEASNFGDSLN